MRAMSALSASVLIMYQEAMDICFSALAPSWVQDFSKAVFVVPLSGWTVEPVDLSALHTSVSLPVSENVAGVRPIGPH